MKKRKFEKLLKTMSALLIVFSTICLTIWLIDSNNITDISEEILKSSEIKKDKKSNTISVNFNNLTTINKDTIGWLSITNTNISYPCCSIKR